MRKNLFSIGADAKTIKGQKLGFLTGILYMAPATISGFQVCPFAKLAVCEAACLYRAGLGGVYTSVQNARIAKARAYFENRVEFMRDIAYSIAYLINKAVIIGAIPLVRLNGTSDIRYENTPINIDAKTAKGIKKLCGFVVAIGDYDNIMAVFPDIQFYDYTKDCNRRDIPANYDLTFSYSGVVSFQRYVNIAMQNGMRIAAVFRTRESIPARFLGLECIDGDDSDVRHIEPRGVIVALYAKGPAKKDNTGFVVDTARVIPLRMLETA
jgi:hypothetical protein